MSSEPKLPTVPTDARLAFIAVLVLGGLASIIDNGVVGWIVGPICIALAFFAIARAPLRNTMLVLMFFGLVMENPSEQPASDQWSSPFAPFGALLLAHFKYTLGNWMFFGGMDMLLGAAILKLWLGGRSVGRGPLSTPKPMIRLAQLTYATIVFTWLVGRWRHGDNSMAVWQIDRVMYLPMVFLLCQAAFSHAKDYLAVGKVALAAAAIRASMAIFVRLTVPAERDPLTGESTLPYATTHNDSILFALASVILVAFVLERAGKKAVRLVWLLGPILFGGMVANERRIVWVEIILVFATVYLMTDMNAFKRKLNKLAMITAPIVAGYVAVGWGSQSGIFKPVQVIRSAVDSSSDGSTAWRDLENFNLIFTVRQFPVMGVGYGNGFWEMWPMPYVHYELERFIPHNSILGLYCYGGVIGYFGITALWVGGTYFAIRSYHYSKVPLEKAAALGALSAILVYYLQCFGDMGLGCWTAVFLVGPSMAIACKLAVANGAWSLEPARKRVRPGFASPQPTPRQQV